ncbi:MAG: phosphoglycerate kinase [Candidatus Azotimanducaceae bacterium]
MSIIDIRDLDVAGKRVLVREDLNVPLKKGVVSSDARIRAALPTIRLLLERGAKLMVMSHLGRPEEGVPIADQTEFSMAPVADHIRKSTGFKVRLVDDYLGGVEFGDEDFVLFENVRVNPGESKNDEGLAKKLASLCDIFVMDAFGTAHRAQATTEGVARYAPIAAAGPLMIAELDALGRVLLAPKGPIVAIVGGSKVSSKLEVLDALSAKVDTLIVGGGIANTFIAAQGFEVGASLYEANLVATARKLMDRVNVPVPTDVVVADGFDQPETAVIVEADSIGKAQMVLDIGPKSQAAIAAIIASAGTIIWNGPVGVFEQPAFAGGTRSLAEAIAQNTGFSIAGGGDTLAAIDQFGITDKVSYISTGGGAFLEFVEGKVLPAVAVLESRGTQS